MMKVHRREKYSVTKYRYGITKYMPGTPTDQCRVKMGWMKGCEMKRI
jgi:hypothetical protein